MLKEFKAFLMKGNLVDLAVALILALAFAGVVSAFTTGIVGGLVAAIAGKPSLSSLHVVIGKGSIEYGAFLDAVINFVIVGFVLFLVVKAYDRFRKEQEAAGPSEVELLTQIRDSLTQRGA